MADLKTPADSVSSGNKPHLLTLVPLAASVSKATVSPGVLDAEHLPSMRISKSTFQFIWNYAVWFDVSGVDQNGCR